MTALYALQTPDNNLKWCIGEKHAQKEYDYLNQKWESVRIFRIAQVVDMTPVFESDQ